MTARRLALAIMAALPLAAGCGVDTATTAAVAAKAGQEEARQGQQMQQEVVDRINAAGQQERQRIDQAAQGQP